MYNFHINMIPQKGFAILYFDKQVIFESYEIQNRKIVLDNCDLLEQGMPNKAHFFDNREEYRFIKRESRHDIIEKVFSEEEEHRMDPDLLYYEDVFIDKKFLLYTGYPKKIRIINRYVYSENDTLVLKNYRIALI